jgi:hypothetical protein
MFEVMIEEKMEDGVKTKHLTQKGVCIVAAKRVTMSKAAGGASVP